MVFRRLGRRHDPAVRQQGFTIVEFMIATTVFSLIILLCSYAIIHIGRVYYKGVITNRTQDTARRLSDDLVTVVQLGGMTAGPQVGTGSGGRRAICLGTNRYTYVTDKSQGDQIDHVLWKDRYDGTGCPPVEDLDVPEPSPGGRSMLGTDMRLPKLEVADTGVPGQWSVEIRVAYGKDADLFESGSDFGVCKGILAGGQFCAVSNIQTRVTKRL